MGFDVGFVPYNPDGWGPPEADVAPPSLGGGSSSVPFAPFSRSDKLGRIADWTRNPPGHAAMAAARDAVFDFAGLEDSVGLASADDASFRLVDGKPPPRHPRFGPRWRFQQKPQLPQHRDEEVEAWRRESEKERARHDRHWQQNRHTHHQFNLGPHPAAAARARRPRPRPFLRQRSAPQVPEVQPCAPPVRRIDAPGRRHVERHGQWVRDVRVL